MDHAHDSARSERTRPSHPELAPHTPPPAFTASETRQARRLGIVLVVIALFFVAELTGARIAKSDVLQADALHLLMDVVALAMSLFAMRLAIRRPTARFTYGLRRAEPVAALVNCGLVLLACAEIVREALGHIRGSEAPRAGVMLVVASMALLVNGLSAWLLHDAIHHGHGHGEGRHGHGHAHGEAHDHHAHAGTPSKKGKAKGHTLNLRGAWLHLLGDTLGSVAALIAAIVIRSGGPIAVDPIASLVVVLILVIGAVRLLRDAVVVLLEAAPAHLDVDEVVVVLKAIPDVVAIHDLHVWSLGAGHDAITVHVRTGSTDASLARRISDELRAAFEVEYVTVQLEREDADCDAPQSRYIPADRDRPTMPPGA